MTQFKGIIFDLDGTLVDSEIVWEVAENEMFKERGLIITPDVREQLIGRRLDEFMAKLIEIYDLKEAPDTLRQELIDRMLEKIPTMVKAKPGASELIEWTAQQNIPYCIASSSPQAIIDASLLSQNWQELIPLRYSADLVANGKPAPDIYLYAAEQLGIAPADCLAIEDSPNGARAAIAANMTCYAVPDGHSSLDTLKQITPHAFHTLNEVLTNLIR